MIERIILLYVLCDTIILFDNSRKDIFRRNKMFSILFAVSTQSPKMRAARREKTISYADDGNEEDSLKIRSGRRRHDEVTCGKFGRVYSHGEFVPPCILCISSGGSFRSSENQEITEKVEERKHVHEREG